MFGTIWSRSKLVTGKYSLSCLVSPGWPKNKMWYNSKSVNLIVTLIDIGYS